MATVDWEIIRVSLFCRPPAGQTLRHRDSAPRDANADVAFSAS